jgi:amino acid transporter
MIALHQVVARYLYALGRERVVPRPLSFVSSPHDNSVRTGPRRRRGRSGGVPIAGSATQSALALTVVVAAGLLGLDPIATVFTGLVTLSALGLLTLMTGTCVAVIAYYRRRDDRPTWWVWCGAPALGGLALATALGVTVANLGPTLADPSGVAPFLLPLLVVGAAVAGALRARWLRGHDEGAWLRLGRGRPAPLALRDVVVADLEL